MTAAEMRAYLKKEYGFNNDEEFAKAYNECKGLDIGIFTTPIPWRDGKDKRKAERSDANVR